MVSENPTGKPQVAHTFYLSVLRLTSSNACRQLGTKDIKKVTDKAAEQMALAKDPSEQKGKKKDRSGIPDAEELAAILEPGAKPKTKSSYRPPRRRDDN